MAVATGGAGRGTAAAGFGKAKIDGLRRGRTECEARRAWYARHRAARFARRFGLAA